MYLFCKIRSESFASKVESENLVLLLVTIINNRNIIVLGCEISFRNIVFVQTLKEQVLRNTENIHY